MPKVNDLPSGLLALIFIILTDASLYARSIDDQSYGLVDYPTLLLSASSRWRLIAISTPYLWFYLDLTTRTDVLQDIERAKCYVERSYSYPIRLRMGREHSDRAFPQRYVDGSTSSLLHLIAPRLRPFALSFQYVDFAKEAISIMCHHCAGAPILELLSLYAGNDSKLLLADPDLLPQEQLAQLLEPLHTLYLERVSFDWGFISCRNLVELQLVNLPRNGRPTTK
jgi:hypothetical protein